MSLYTDCLTLAVGERFAGGNSFGFNPEFHRFMDAARDPETYEILKSVIWVCERKMFVLQGLEAFDQNLDTFHPNSESRVDLWTPSGESNETVNAAAHLLQDFDVFPLFPQQIGREEDNWWAFESWSSYQDKAYAAGLNQLEQELSQGYLTQEDFDQSRQSLDWSIHSREPGLGHCRNSKTLISQSSGEFSDAIAWLDHVGARSVQLADDSGSDLVFVLGICDPPCESYGDDETDQNWMRNNYWLGWTTFDILRGREDVRSKFHLNKK